MSELVWNSRTCMACGGLMPGECLCSRSSGDMLRELEDMERNGHYDPEEDPLDEWLGDGEEDDDSDDEDEDDDEDWWRDREEDTSPTSPSGPYAGGRRPMSVEEDRKQARNWASMVNRLDGEEPLWVPCNVDGPTSLFSIESRPGFTGTDIGKLTLSPLYVTNPSGRGVDGEEDEDLGLDEDGLDGVDRDYLDRDALARENRRRMLLNTFSQDEDVLELPATMEEIVENAVGVNRTKVRVQALRSRAKLARLRLQAQRRQQYR